MAATLLSPVSHYLLSPPGYLGSDGEGQRMVTAAAATLVMAAVATLAGSPASTPGELRTRIISQVWGSTSLPTAGADTVTKYVGYPLLIVPPPSNMYRTDLLEFNAKSCGISDTVFVWVMRPHIGAKRAVIFHAGHGSVNNPVNNGREELMTDLIQAGYTVAFAAMPLNANSSSHDALPRPTPGCNALNLFMGPVVRLINYLQGERFTKTFMSGSSGGGWATTLAAAIDVRIKASAPVAGSLPLYIQNIGPGRRDWEQLLPGLSSFLDYPDLHALATDGGREQIQILNTGDPCCFNKAAYDSGAPYAAKVSTRAQSWGGVWSLKWSVNNKHSITPESRRIIMDLFARHWRPR